MSFENCTEQFHPDKDILDDRELIPLTAVLNEVKQTKNESELQLISVPIPPDGGYGWIVVIASSMCIGTIDGIAFTFGLYLNHIAEHFDISLGLAALSSSLFGGIAYIIGPFTTGLINQFGSRTIIITGSIIASIGIFSCVFCTRFMHFCILYGVFGGVGASFVYISAIVHVGFYFEKRRALATGLAVSGSGIGIAVVSVSLPVFLESYTWQGTQWILAGAVLQCAVYGALMRPVPLKILEVKETNDEAKLLCALPGLSEEASDADFDDPQPSWTVSEAPTPINSYRHSVGFESSLHIQEEVALRDMIHIKDLGKPPLLQQQISAVESCIEENRPYGKNPRYPRQNSSKQPHLSSKPYKSHSQLLVFEQISSKLRSAKVSEPMSVVQLLHRGNIASSMYRSDMFYTGSVQDLPEYHRPRVDLMVYKENMIILPQITKEDDGIPFTTATTTMFSRGRTRILASVPIQIRNVCTEMLDFRLIKNPLMLLLILCSMFASLGMYIPFTYTCDKVMKHGATLSQSGALLAVCGIANTLGRVAIGWLANSTPLSATSLLAVTLVISGACTVTASFIHGYYLLAVYTAVFGFFLAGISSLASIVIVDHFGLPKLTNGFGLMMLARGLSGAISTPIGGVIYKSTESYAAVYCFAGAMMIAGGVSAALMHVVKLTRCDLGLRKEVCEIPDDMIGLNPIHLNHSILTGNGVSIPTIAHETSTR